MENYDITLSEYWRIIRKRKMTIFAVFLSVVLSTVVFTKLQTPVYQASLEMKIEKHSSMLLIENNSTSAISTGGSSNLATEIRLIKSLPVLEKVVEKMEVLPADPVKRKNSIHALSMKYQSNVFVEQIPDTNIVTIKVNSNDARKSALIATAISDVYIVENVEGRKKQLKAVLAYIDNQLNEYKTQIAEEESKLQKFQQNEKVFEVTSKIKKTLDRMTVEGTFEFESKMQKIESELKSVDSALNKLPEAKKFEELTGDNSTENYIFVGLKRRLLELEFQRFLLLIDYTEKHPAVVEKDKVIADIKNKIVERLKESSSVAITPEVEEGLSLVIKKLFLENSKEVLYRIVNRFYEDEGSLSSNQLQYVTLKRNVERLLSSFDTLLSKRSEMRLELAKVIDDVVTVVSPANPPRTPIKPNAGVNYSVSVVVGLLLGILFCFVKESVDSTVSTISDVEAELGLPILGIVPHMKREDVLPKSDELIGEKDKKIILQRARLITITDPKSWHAESIKMLRSNLMQALKTKNIRAVLFTSSDKQEGKSTMVANIALSMAQLGKKVALVGSNMRRPTIYKTFGLNREPGLSDVLMGNISWKEAINSSVDILTGGISIDKLLQMPGIDNLKILTCGHPVDNVSELLNSKDFDLLIKDLKNYFDFIIVDCSPVMAVPDAVTLCDKVDAVVLVYKVGHTPKDVLKMAKNNLVNANANILGVVLNDIKTEAQVGYSAYYYRYYSETPPKKGNIIEKWKEQIAQASKKQDDIFNP